MGTEQNLSARRYAIIAPSRDEAATMRRTLDSIAGQTILPHRMVFVDDGSTDDTAAILEEYLPKMPFLSVVRLPDRGARVVGPGVIRAFNAGLATVDLSEVEFLCKLDMDLDLPADYFEQLVARMDADAELATCSGKSFFRDPRSGQLVSESLGDQFSVGMTKFYRASAFEAIGGFPTSIGWDGIDCHLCRMIGMKAASFDDPALRFVHLRPMGSSHVSVWHGRTRHGLGAWVMGVPLLFMIVASIYRLAKWPRITGGLFMMWGYLHAQWSGVERYGPAGYRAFVRSYYLRSLRIGRARAAEEMRLKSLARGHDVHRTESRAATIALAPPRPGR